MQTLRSIAIGPIVIGWPARFEPSSGSSWKSWKIAWRRRFCPRPSQLRPQLPQLDESRVETTRELLGKGQNASWLPWGTEKPGNRIVPRFNLSIQCMQYCSWFSWWTIMEEQDFPDSNVGMQHGKWSNLQFFCLNPHLSMFDYQRIPSDLVESPNFGWVASESLFKAIFRWWTSKYTIDNLRFSE